MLKNIITKWRRMSAEEDMTEKVSTRTTQYYRCHLPKEGGGGSRILRFLFSGIRLNPEQKDVVTRIPENAILVYAIPYKSKFEFLFYHTRYAREGLPVPEIGFDYTFLAWQPLSRLIHIVWGNIRHLCRHFSLQNPYETGYIRQELLSGKAGLLSLVEEGGFYRRFVKKNPDPLVTLIELQDSFDRPVYIVPQLIFYGRNPQRSKPSTIDMLFGTRENPGRLRRLVILLKRTESVFVEISEPLDLKEFISHPDRRDLERGQQAMTLRQHLLSQINRHRQSIIGPTLKTHEEIKENILTNPRLREYMAQYAENKNLPPYKVYREADEYLDEIAARFSMNITRILSAVVRWLTNVMFEGISINTEAMNRIKGLSRRGPLVLIPCHKSHIDYLVISYIMFHNDMPCPLIAAGKNLSFWPLGPLFRGAGAFFIRRTFKGAALYSKVFAEYVHKILSEGFNVEFFIEGTRSRTGKLLQPKLGLLSILLNALKAGACEDLIFVPVFVGYDRVPEEGAYLRELEGGQKKPESVMGIIKARKVLKKRYGRIYIRFGEGVSIRDHLRREEGADLQSMGTKDLNGFTRKLGHMMLCAIDAATVITPHAVVAAAILNAGQQRLSRKALLTHVETYMAYLASQPVQFADTLVMDQTRAFEYVIEAYLYRRFIEPVSDTGTEEGEDDDDVIYQINASRRPAVGYYKNNCIKAFIPAAFTALSILDRDAFQFYQGDIVEGYESLKELFRFEFSYDIERSPSYFVQKNVAAFVGDAILMPHPDLSDAYNLTASGYRKLRLFAMFLESFLESYWVVLNFLHRYPRDFMDGKDRVNKITSMGHRMLKSGEIRCPEAISGVNFRNGLDYFNAVGIRGSEDEEGIRAHMTILRRYLERLRS